MYFFDPYLSPTYNTNIDSFVGTFVHSVLNTNDAFAALRRLMVLFIVLNKDPVAVSRHKYLAAQVLDTQDDKLYIFIIECTVSTSRVEVKNIYTDFSQSPDCKAIIDAIALALQNLSSSLFGSATPTPSSDTVPLIPISMTATSPSTSASSPTTQTTGTRSTPEVSTVDKITLALATVAHSLARSTNAPMYADDKVSRGKHLAPTETIRQVSPEGLSLYHFAMIADVVHSKALTYSLFRNQCYWYARLIFNAVERLFPSTSGSRPGPICIPSDAGDIVLLFGGGVSDGAGRWMGLLINDPTIEEEVLTSVISEFIQRIKLQEDLVIFHRFKLTIPTKSQKDDRNSETTKIRNAKS